MATNLVKLIRQFIHFFAGNMLALILGLATFPILTQSLSKEQYGTLGIITTTIMLMVALAKGGLSEGILRYYKISACSVDNENIFNSTVVFIGLMQSLITVFLYLLSIQFLYKKINMGAEQYLSFVVMAIVLIIRPLSIAIQSILRVKNKTIFVNIIGVGNKVLAVLLSLGILFFLIPNLFGYFVGLAVADCLVVAILLSWLLLNYEIRWAKKSPALASMLMKFGLPLLVSEMAYLLISYADRYMIAICYGNNAVGEYSAGYNLANYISGVITFSLSFAIVPTYVEIYASEGRKKTEEFLATSISYLLMGIIPICFGYYAVVDDLFFVLTSGKYMGAANFSPVILVGTFALGLNSVFYAGLYLQNKSIHILVISIGAVILNIALNLFMLPVMGLMGSAFATLVTCLAMNIVTVWMSMPYVNIRLYGWKIFRYLLISITMVAIIKSHPIIGLMELFWKVWFGVLFVGMAVLLFDKEVSYSFLRWCRRAETYAGE